MIGRIAGAVSAGAGGLFSKRRRIVPLNLALQGGGVHGAFTWGVLDRLLLDSQVSVRWISGTSAGAVNAVAVAHGLATGGPEQAVETLKKLWHGVVDAQVPDLVKLNPFMAGLVRAASIPKSGQVLSPYEFNPLGIDPFRRLLERTIDFERIAKSPACNLLLAATNIATGRPRLFRTHEITVDAVLASACLPVLHHAVTIDGEAYWDGGFSANPDLLGLISASPIEDTLIVQLNPSNYDSAAIPRSLRDISDRAETLAFNQAYLRDIAEIVRMQRAPGDRGKRQRDLASRVRRHRFHLIEAGEHTSTLDQSTKVHAEGQLVGALHDAGGDEA
ncbi:MAG: patatin-like phospholipase family protein, partial [Pseudomonadota bacterium]